MFGLHSGAPFRPQRAEGSKRARGMSPEKAIAMVAVFHAYFVICLAGLLRSDSVRDLANKCVYLGPLIPQLSAVVPIKPLVLKVHVKTSQKRTPTYAIPHIDPHLCSFVAIGLLLYTLYGVLGHELPTFVPQVNEAQPQKKSNKRGPVETTANSDEAGGAMDAEEPSTGMKSALSAKLFPNGCTLTSASGMSLFETWTSSQQRETMEAVVKESGVADLTETFTNKKLHLMRLSAAQRLQQVRAHFYPTTTCRPGAPLLVTYIQCFRWVSPYLPFNDSESGRRGSVGLQEVWT